MIELTVTEQTAANQATQYVLPPNTLLLGATGDHDANRIHLTVPQSWSAKTVRLVVVPGGILSAAVGYLVDSDGILPVSAAMTAARRGMMMVEALGADGYAAHSTTAEYRCHPHPEADAEAAAQTPSEYQQLLAAIPAGGTAGQLLMKKTDRTRDTAWGTVRLADLTDDDAHRTVSDAEKAQWNRAATIGAYTAGTGIAISADGVISLAVDSGDGVSY